MKNCFDVKDSIAQPDIHSKFTTLFLENIVVQPLLSGKKLKRNEF